MKELQLVLTDDLTHHLTGERVPADETVLIALDGRSRELDLSAQHAKELRELLAPYMAAGHMPDMPPVNPTEKHVKTPTPSLVLARARQKLIRDFADERGMRSPDGKRPIYRTASGGYYYSFRLMRMYEAHLEAEARQQGGRDAAR